MRKLVFSAAVLGLCAAGLGCAMPRSPIPGYFYTDVSDALMVNPGEIPATARVGEATARTIVGVTTGDCSISAAKGTMTKIYYVDYYSYGILGLFGHTTTRVYGE